HQRNRPRDPQPLRDGPGYPPPPGGGGGGVGKRAGLLAPSSLAAGHRLRVTTLARDTSPGPPAPAAVPARYPGQRTHPARRARAAAQAWDRPGLPARPPIAASGSTRAVGPRVVA